MGMADKAIIELLLRKGAALNFSSNGQSPLLLARKLGNSTIIGLLESYGKS